MIELINILAEKYAAKFSSSEDVLLQQISTYTNEHHPQSHMLSGQVQGQLLTLISSLLQPKRILEIGTFTGYSALCLAKGLHQQGMLHTIELRETDAAIAQSFFNKSICVEKIQLHVGNAKQIIPALEETWDLVFIDADKTGYIDYYELVLPKLKANGLIIADNVLFYGHVFQENLQGKNAIAIDAFNRHVKNDERVEQVMLTVRDGLLFIRKL